MAVKKIIVGVSGASGTIYAVDLLKQLHAISNVEVHLVMSSWAKKNHSLESDYSIDQIKELANYT
ncbi:flavoprotein, partial [Oenococcus oeni]|uniref:flavoprotein n=1 Tax=Oenococcus oeni TaxID=1247 RepID=UPI0023B9B571